MFWFLIKDISFFFVFKMYLFLRIIIIIIIINCFYLVCVNCRGRNADGNAVPNRFIRCWTLFFFSPFLFSLSFSLSVLRELLYSSLDVIIKKRMPEAILYLCPLPFLCAFFFFYVSREKKTNTTTNKRERERERLWWGGGGWRWRKKESLPRNEQLSRQSNIDRCPGQQQVRRTCF